MAFLELVNSAWESWSSVILSSTLLLSLPQKIRLLHRAPDNDRPSSGANWSIVFPLAFLAIQSTVAMHIWPWAGNSDNVAILDVCLSLGAAIGLVVIDLLERKRIVSPSRLVAAFLAFSLFRDAVELAISSDCPRSGNCHLVRLRGCLEGVWLVWDYGVRGPIGNPSSKVNSSSEETARIFSRVFFWWINPVIREGYRTNLSLHNLPDIHEKLSSETLRKEALKSWTTQAEPRTKWSLLLSLARCLKPAFLSPVIPRLFVILFRYAQPVFIDVAIQYVRSSASADEVGDGGLRLVLVAGIVYMGMAISEAVYQHQINRLKIMVRGSLVGLIHHQSLNAPSTGSEDSQALTLLSSDIESIQSVGQIFHETWAQMLEVIVGTALLAAQIRWFAFLPLIIIFGCSRMSAYVAKHLQGRQRDWNVATQERISATSSALGGIKSLKMMGMEDPMQSQISDLREQELRMSKRLRWIMVAYNASANALGIFAPVLTLVLYAMSPQTHGVLQPSEIFTSVALLAMVTHPANMVMTFVPRAVAMMANVTRVQDYISKPSVQDNRGFPAERDFGQSAVIENMSIKPLSTASPILQDICLNLRKGELVICGGAVGSGKTTLAMAMLGEAPAVTGTVCVGSKKIAYCAQAPWLPSVTIRDAISGGVDEDVEWYDTVIDACGLVPDLTTLIHGDMTPIENNGINLSGGQRQRIALARAVYSRYSILLLDDPFSALDENVTNSISHKLLGSEGLFKRMGTTVLLTSNLRRLYSLADRVLILHDSKAQVEDLISFEDTAHLAKTSALADTSLSVRELNTQAQKQSSQKNRMNDAAEDISRRTGDVAVYSYYINAVGISNVLLITCCTATYSFCFTFSQYVLKWATQSPPQTVYMYMVYYAAISFIAWVATNGLMWSTQMRAAIQSGKVLHAQLLERILKASLPYFTTTDIGVTLNRFGQDITLIDKQLPPALVNLITQIFKLLVQVMLLLVAQPVMAATVPACAICVYFIQRLYLRTSRQFRFLDLESRSQLYTNFLDTSSGVTTIRAFGWKDKFQEENIKALDLSQKPFYLLLCLQCWLKVILDCVIAIVAVVLMTLTVMYRNTTTGADIGLALNMIIAANATLLKLVQSWTSLETSLGAIARLKNVQESVPIEERSWGTLEPGPQWPSSGEIEVQNASVSYSESQKLALEDVSLAVNPGQKMIVVGRTGSGKSTLMLSLLQLLTPKSGSIQIDDVDITRVPLRTLRQRGLIAVPQDGFNIPTASLRFNLDPFETSSEDSIVIALNRVRLWDKISTTFSHITGAIVDPSTDMYKLLDLPMSTFLPCSAGELQLFALCRTLLRVWSNASSKPVIVLDEASSSLDPETESILEGILREDLSGHTVVMIAHRVEGIMGAMRPGVDAIATMQDGRLHEVSRIESPPLLEN
ncbi:putative ATP-binding cassette transporter [Aspergillus ellipticus CBS 707.79]|uniref:Putative ATP-binding cassette transporter n=1 Tax=Aspergillus ellipticus CBS 707.79 TaxID=1448320 RepID=A0A319DCY1_9EURO|nr:putative ATP-binding cassette transporter [Aspergillus ellipticus CBS 707.79]